MQPLQLVVIKHKELQEQLLPHSFQQQQIVTASHLLVICIEKNIDDTGEEIVNVVATGSGSVTKEDIKKELEKRLICEHQAPSPQFSSTKNFSETVLYSLVLAFNFNQDFLI